MATNEQRLEFEFMEKKSNLMSMAYELSVIGNTQVLVFVHHDGGKSACFCTIDFQPVVTSDSGKQLIQSCLDNNKFTLLENEGYTVVNNISNGTNSSTPNREEANPEFTERKSQLLSEVEEVSAICNTHGLALIMNYDTGELTSFFTKSFEPVVASEAGKKLLKLCIKEKN
ncbi:uncharacterized protein LOC107222374 [Neodiprion lecontei]|uniref:Uncharacterized protein LOC107222374 n=1 Tax=Neodiprion lecontei TaxID=441921 RepID=A0A6J0BSC4_NEOLC|nr:uncharacterized protein LOC107222374 [Neodiprion lecontei]